MPPDANPMAAPARANRVGANPLVDQASAAKTGTDSVAISTGQDAHVLPKTSSWSRAGSAAVNSIAAIDHISRTGAARPSAARATPAPGFERRESANSPAAASDRT